MARTSCAPASPPSSTTAAPAAADALVAEGAESASRPGEVAERSDVVVMMLPDSPDVEAVVLGEDGVAAGLPRGDARDRHVDHRAREARQVHALAGGGSRRSTPRCPAASPRPSTGSCRSWPGAATRPSSGPRRSSRSSARRPPTSAASRCGPGRQGRQPGRGRAHDPGGRRGADAGRQGRSRSRSGARGAAGRLRAVEDPRGTRRAHARGVASIPASGSSYIARTWRSRCSRAREDGVAAAGRRPGRRAARRARSRRAPARSTTRRW